MFVGVAIGAYSSIFLAAPLLAVLKTARRSATSSWRPAAWCGPEAVRRRSARGRGRAAGDGETAAAVPPPRAGDGRPGAARTGEHAPARQAQAEAATGGSGAGDVMDIEQIKSLIRDVPDFPEPGIVFKDITPVLADPIAFSTITDLIVVRFGRGNVDKVVGIEARGFIIASPVAYHFGAGFVPIRKQGKLPSGTGPRTTSSSTARPRSSCTSTASTPASGC